MQNLDDGDIQMGSYSRRTNFNNFMYLEDFCPNKIDPQTDFKIYCLQNDELIIFTFKNIYIIDFINWIKKKNIYLEDKIIQNSYYLNGNCFLLFFGYYYNDNFDDYNLKEFEITKYEGEDNFALMKFYGNGYKIIYQNLISFCRKLYYNFKENSDQFGLSQPIIAVSGNLMKFYRLVNIKRSFKI